MAAAASVYSREVRAVRDAIMRGETDESVVRDLIAAAAAAVATTTDTWWQAPADTVAAAAAAAVARAPPSSTVRSDLLKPPPDDALSCTLLAARHGAHVVLRALLEGGYGSVGDTISPWGSSAMTLAVSRGHIDAVRLLAARGGASLPDSMGGGPLALASRCGNTAAMRVLLDAGAPVEKGYAPNCVPLLLAARFGHADAVALLLAHGADANVADTHRLTPLLLAAWHGHTNVVCALLSHGTADVTHTDPFGETAFVIAAKRGHALTVDALLTHAERAEAAVAAGAVAAGAGAAGAAGAVAADAPAAAHVPPQRGWGSMRLASVAGMTNLQDARRVESLMELTLATWKHARVLGELLAHGANPRGRIMGCIPFLTFAIFSCSTDMVETLAFADDIDLDVRIQAADVDAMIAQMDGEALSRDEATAHAVDEMFDKLENEDAALCGIRMTRNNLAECMESVASVVSPVAQCARGGGGGGVPREGQEGGGHGEHAQTQQALRAAYTILRMLEGMPPLHVATVTSRADAVRLLLDAGANVFARDANGSTALDVAQRMGNEDMIPLLIEAVQRQYAEQERDNEH